MGVTGKEGWLPMVDQAVGNRKLRLVDNQIDVKGERPKVVRITAN